MALPQAIVGYRETEKLHWTEPTSVALVERLRGKMAAAMGEGVELETIQEIHVLDLAADGEIKPHIDSVKVRTLQLPCELFPILAKIIGLYDSPMYDL